ncbi:hypothetical protein TCDM_12105 [Trypanosoma cruzi Dm28c]|uniref:Uncharacterized protein n=1 Tax=Trypanosoma cruzi Dm28c TaxID=1416333 RepID=V5B7M7_TRYCR|nr:hypothetical protein TCDM_12105 [Trypanosoma cruzi Dm28c]
MRLRCTVFYVPPRTLLPFFFFFALCFCRHTQPHTHKMRIAVDLNASFVVHAGSCVWRLLSFSVCVAAAESAGHVSGDAEAVVVPVDVSCAPGDDILSHRVWMCVGVEEVFCCRC